MVAGKQCREREGVLAQPCCQHMELTLGAPDGAPGNGGTSTPQSGATFQHGNIKFCEGTQQKCQEETPMSFKVRKVKLFGSSTTILGSQRKWKITQTSQSNVEDCF